MFHLVKKCREIRDTRHVSQNFKIPDTVSHVFFASRQWRGSMDDDACAQLWILKTSQCHKRIEKMW